MIFLQGTMDIAKMLEQSASPDMVHAWWTDVFPIGRPGKLKKIAAIFDYLYAEGGGFSTRAELLIDGGRTI